MAGTKAAAALLGFVALQASLPAACASRPGWAGPLQAVPLPPPCGTQPNGALCLRWGPRLTAAVPAAIISISTHADHLWHHHPGSHQR